MTQRLLTMLLAVVLLAACGSAPSNSATAPESAAAPQEEAEGATDAAADADAENAPAGNAAASELQDITVAMSFIPNVQFAHFYVAEQQGYYAEEGLNVTFDYNFETDVVQRVAQGTVQFGLAGGDSVLLARAQGLPVVTVLTNSQQYPVVLFSKAEQGISTPEDLRGASVGIPGRFGASYIGLLAILYASDLAESDLNIQEIGFTQLAAVSEDQVQVAAGYGNNEPLQLAQQGIDVNTIAVADYFPLASDGIITSETLIAEQPELVRSFVRATIRGMQYTLDQTDEAFEISLTQIPELQSAPAEVQALQRLVLEETLPYWQSDITAREGLGYTDPESWQASYTFLRDSGLLAAEVDVDAAFTNAFIE